LFFFWFITVLKVHRVSVMNADSAAPVVCSQINILWLICFGRWKLVTRPWILFIEVFLLGLFIEFTVRQALYCQVTIIIGSSVIFYYSKAGHCRWMLSVNWGLAFCMFFTDLNQDHFFDVKVSFFHLCFVYWLAPVGCPCQWVCKTMYRITYMLACCMYKELTAYLCIFLQAHFALNHSPSSFSVVLQ